jgi:hypothetical protein
MGLSLVLGSSTARGIGASKRRINAQRVRPFPDYNIEVARDAFVGVSNLFEPISHFCNLGPLK